MGSRIALTIAACLNLAQLAWAQQISVTQAESALSQWRRWPYSRITMVFPIQDSSGLDVSNISIHESVTAVKNGNQFIAYNIPIVAGVNQLSIVRTPADSTSVTKSIFVTGAPDGKLGVRLDASPLVGNTVPFQVTLALTLDMGTESPTEMWVDKDGDGIIDAVSPYSSSFNVAYEALGRYKPSITIITKTGTLLTTDPIQSPVVSLLESPAFASEPSVTLPRTRDIAFLANQRLLYALSSNPPAVVIVNIDTGVVLNTISISGASAPEGMGLDADGNIYVADTGNNQILRLLKGNAYLPDLSLSPAGAFGSVGSGDGQLQHPSDVGIERDGGQDWVVVADRGNNRIQIFTAAGAYKSQFNGSKSAEGGVVAPRRVVADGSHLVAILDASTHGVRGFDRFGNSSFSFGQSNGLSAPLTATDLSLSPDGQVVLDGPANRVVFFGEKPGNSFSVPSGTGAIFMDTKDGPTRLWAVPSGGGHPWVATLPMDPPGSGPLDILDKFLSALAAKNISVAKQYAAVHLWAGLDAIAADSVYLAQVAHEAQIMTGIHLTFLEPDSAFARGTIPGQTYLGDFPLERSFVTGEWQVNAINWHVSN